LGKIYRYFATGRFGGPGGWAAVGARAGGDSRRGAAGTGMRSVMNMVKLAGAAAGEAGVPKKPKAELNASVGAFFAQVDMSEVPAGEGGVRLVRSTWEDTTTPPPSPPPAGGKVPSKGKKAAQPKPVGGSWVGSGGGALAKQRADAVAAYKMAMGTGFATSRPGTPGSRGGSPPAGAMRKAATMGEGISRHNTIGHEEELVLFEVGDKPMVWNDIIRMMMMHNLMSPALSPLRISSAGKIVTCNQELMSQEHTNNKRCEVTFEEFLELLARFSAMHFNKEATLRDSFRRYMDEEFVASVAKNWKGRF